MSNFIQEIAPIIVKEATARGYKFPSAIIAQACLESAYGESSLAKTYHNYFGMKCGSSWKGKSVNLSTKEEYAAGTLTTIRDNFRVYDSMEEGVKGYFDFINTKRYSNLKEATSARDYLLKIKNDGYATSSAYVSNVYRVITLHSLQTYDGESKITTNTETPADLNSAINIIAKYVIKGYFGNGHDKRKEAIYKLIREAVNDGADI